mgnify:CR=1 FL=1
MYSVCVIYVPYNCLKTIYKPKTLTHLTIPTNLITITISIYLYIYTYYIVHGEKATREHRSIKDTISRINTQHEEYKYNCDSVIKGFEERLLQSVTVREEETRKRVLIQEQNTELRANIDTLRTQVC